MGCVADGIRNTRSVSYTHLTLPTNGAARFRGGLSAADFVRVSSVQTLTRRGLTALGPAIVTLAEAEGLTQHARSITVRMPNAKTPKKKVTA